jgi:tyrosyl-tRNA synthetase
MQKEYGQEPQVVITMPLLEGLDGVNKMSKSLGNYVGITDEPADMFGKLMSISDELMFRYFELLSTMTMEDISRLRDDMERGAAHPRDVKVMLATELVSRFHDEAAAVAARRAFEAQFSRGEVPEDIPVYVVSGGESSVYIPRALKEAGLVKSAGEARRLLKQGAISVDGRKLDSDEVDLPGNGLVMKIGKRRYLKITKG